MIFSARSPWWCLTTTAAKTSSSPCYKNCNACRYTVPHKVGDQVVPKELWLLTPDNKYNGLEQWLWEMDYAERGTPVELIPFLHELPRLHRLAKTGETCRERQRDGLVVCQFLFLPGTPLRQGVVETARLSTLVRPPVFATRNPETCPPENYQPWASAAAQWIIYAGDALYELCKKENTTEIGRQKWTLSLWDEWKARFEVATPEKFDYKRQRWGRWERLRVVE